MSRNFKISVSAGCILLAVLIFFITSGGDGYDTKGMMMFLKCEKCANVVEIDADKYQKHMKELTEGLSSFELMGNPNLGIKCEKCNTLLRVAVKDPQTNQVEIVGRKKR